MELLALMFCSAEAAKIHLLWDKKRLAAASLLLILLLLNAWFIVFLNTRRCPVEGTFGFTCLF